MHYTTIDSSTYLHKQSYLPCSSVCQIKYIYTRYPKEEEEEGRVILLSLHLLANKKRGGGGKREMDHCQCTVSMHACQPASQSGQRDQCNGTNGAYLLHIYGNLKRGLQIITNYNGLVTHRSSQTKKMQDITFSPPPNWFGPPGGTSRPCLRLYHCSYLLRGLKHRLPIYFLFKG